MSQEQDQDRAGSEGCARIAHGHSEPRSTELGEGNEHQPRRFEQVTVSARLHATYAANPRTAPA